MPQLLLERPAGRSCPAGRNLLPDRLRVGTGHRCLEFAFSLIIRHGTHPLDLLVWCVGLCLSVLTAILRVWTGSMGWTLAGD